MTAQLLIALALSTPVFYLAARWLRAQLAMYRLRRLSHIWSDVQQTWEQLGRLPQGSHSQTLRTAFATLQRSRLIRLRSLAPDHERAKAHLRLTSQFLRGQYHPPAPRTPANTRTKLATVQALRASLNGKTAQAALESGLIIRADAELNQWMARLELDDFTSGAMRDALLGKRKEALLGIKQALTCLPRLPVSDADSWRIKLSAEQRRLRTTMRSNAA